MTVDIDPVALSLGGIAVRWYGLLAVAAICLAFVLVRRGTRRAGIPEHLVADGAMWVGLAALIGGRALYVLQNEFSTVLANPLHAFAIWHGGLSFYGGLATGLLALWLFARRAGLRFARVADIAAPAAAAGQAVGHIGCFAGGDSYGLPTSLPWAVTYANPGAMAPLGVPLHPTQLYEAAALVILAAALISLRRPLAPLGPGALAAMYLVGLAAIRFLLFFYRDDVAVLGGLKVAQVIGLAIAALGLMWLGRLALDRKTATTRRSEALP